MIKKTTFFLLLMIVFTGQVMPQTAGGSIMLGFPQGEFKENVDRLGYGLQFHGTLWSPNKLKPITVGANIGYLIYGEERESRRFSLTIPDVIVDVSRTNSIFNFHLLVQISPFTGTWRPYLEALGGGAYISTSTSIESEWDIANDIATSTNFDDFTWSYGGGAGLLIKIGEDLGDITSLYLDLKGRYLFGTKAEYLAEGSITIDETNGNVFYDVLKSTTDLVTIHLGVVAYFN